MVLKTGFPPHLTCVSYPKQDRSSASAQLLSQVDARVDTARHTVCVHPNKQQGIWAELGSSRPVFPLERHNALLSWEAGRMQDKWCSVRTAPKKPTWTSTASRASGLSWGPRGLLRLSGRESLSRRARP